MDAIPPAIDSPRVVDTPDVSALLPDGWQSLDIPGLERPAAVGPAGVFVFVVRHRDMRPVGLADPAPWPDRRHRMSAAQMTAELASQILSSRLGRHVPVRPVVVISTIDALVLDRPDAVHVVHIEQLAWWLSQQPASLDREAVATISAAVDTISRDAAATPLMSRSSDETDLDLWPRFGRLAG